ncbi:hypothetical protein PSMK_15680 [Phycisphaera mikurensis NBRC 102666]|uniref:Endonuclease/exonuclease/phosphatase domain-containing protein n=1 Tax=Phycisphaera mikurensis (strain NBRC 102666 / KCTC 22515 / FYK2301M01) TaxID=1142394 RepID=I0IEN9_PHYMF|nr:hypothetical protein PSMK_15680 [Phycisphaera mikurensis NBRC 102666]
MPFYKPLKHAPAAERKRTIRGIQRLRAQLAEAGFPGKKTAETLILGTWNLRNFDDDRFGHGPRTDESLHYLAEIVARFDALAVQEIGEDLGPLQRLLALAGPQYDYLLTDVTHSGLGGNRERLGFVYDRHKVRFTGVSGEIVLPDRLLIGRDGGAGGAGGRQFARTPFGAAFHSGWFKFVFSTVHVYFGAAGRNSPQYERRVQEIEAVAGYLAAEAGSSEANHVLVGDFNIVAPGSDGFNALERAGFTAVQNRRGSNADQTKFYDQISFLSKRNELLLRDPERDDRVFQFFDSVYRDGDFRMHRSTMKKLLRAKIEAAAAEARDGRTKRIRTRAARRVESLTALAADDAALEAYYPTWRTFQMSDHLPLWVEIKIDFSDAYLEKLLG